MTTRIPPHSPACPHGCCQELANLRQRLASSSRAAAAAPRPGNSIHCERCGQLRSRLVDGQWLCKVCRGKST